jgi:hypothetical protein
MPLTGSGVKRELSAGSRGSTAFIFKTIGNIGYCEHKGEGAGY